MTTNSAYFAQFLLGPNLHGKFRLTVASFHRGGHGVYNQKREDYGIASLPSGKNEMTGVAWEAKAVGEEVTEAAQWKKVEKLYETADRIMEEAVSPEKLRNNPFKGRPLDLSINPFEKGMAMGHRMLKSSGFAPAWIETKAELVQERADIRRMIDEYVERVANMIADVTEDAERAQLVAGADPGSEIWTDSSDHMGQLINAARTRGFRRLPHISVRAPGDE